MTFMTEQQKKVLDRLIQLAGSPLLVDEAFAELSKRTAAPSLEDVVQYILDNRTAWHARRGSHSERQPAEV